MTDLDLDRIEALADAATPGPWEVNSMTHDSDVGDYTVYGIKDVDDATMTYDDSPAFAHTMGMDEADASFIAGTGPDVVKELVRQLREAQKTVGELIKDLEGCDEHCAEAWDEGFNEGHRDARSLTHRDNPYRRNDE